MTDFSAAGAARVDGCILCRGTEFLPVADRDRHGNELRTVLCEGCGFVFTSPRPSQAEVDHFYRSDYRREYKDSYSPKPKHVYRAGKVALSRLAYLKPLLKPNARVLDVGAGGGEMLYLLKEMGLTVQGIEPNLGYGGTARDVLGLPVQVTSYKAAEVEPLSMDVVTSFHVLEHLLDPVEALSIFSRWLKDDGQILIEVPNVFSRCQWPQSRYHRGHLQHFSASTLSLAGHLAGLVAVDSFTSEDGGNVMVVFRKAPDAAAHRLVAGVLPGHAARVKAHLTQHTPLRHFFTLAPWKRPLERAVDRLAEKVSLGSMSSGQEVLKAVSSRLTTVTLA
ncbi:MAG: class I SAM-dependent methyltransferase [Verrucomicrobiaceae bacterium]|nr:class I SAM-dependent methyltransferase [Verrucomicrobiaceae bacterium]